MAFDFKKLRARMIEKYGSQTEFAKAYGVSENTMSRKMQNKVPFSSDDVIKISEMLGISKDDVGSYFFTEKV